MPALSWGHEPLQTIWSSRGMLLNQAALKRARAFRARAGKSAWELTKIFLPNLPLEELSSLCSTYSTI